KPLKQPAKPVQIVMRLTLLRLKQFSDHVAKEFVKYGSYSPTPMSISKLLHFGRNPSQENSFKFLRHEVPVRLANIMQEIHLLPESLVTMPSTKTVIGLYKQSFLDMLAFKDEPKRPSDGRLTDFTETLAQILERHREVVETMAQGVLELKEREGDLDTQTEAQVQYFLDRFYMSRISIRMLISQHVILFGPDLRNNRQIGSIDPHCDIMSVIDHAYNSARFLCEQFYLTAPSMTTQVIGLDKTTEFAYVPSHLYHMVFEIIKNSMRALVEKNEDNMPPIHVMICVGKEDLTIRVSDQGGGIARSELPLVFKYTYTTASPVSPSSSTGPPLAGYGYGLPLSRIYARYLHGELALASVEGYGTDAYIYLKKSSDEANELLPVFNITSAKRYTANLPVPDWSNPSLSNQFRL
ncbi:hypothetical protein BOX15_Mlig002926g1, partial [Macrostomum lignano]